jgi:hypothetical protein
MDGQETGRLTNKERLHMYTRDDENTINLHPLDYVSSKFLTAGMKTANLQSSLMIEQKEKYWNKASSSFKAELELHSIPKCFD